MRLYIMRHGEAEPYGYRDFDRPLTAYGHTFVQQQAQRLNDHLSGARLFASPLLRAQQTASLMAEPLALAVTTLDTLQPDDDPTEALAQLERRLSADDNTIMLVSHMPLVGKLVGILIDGMAAAGPALMPGEIVAIELDALLPGQGRLIQH